MALNLKTRNHEVRVPGVAMLVPLIPQWHKRLQQFCYDGCTLTLILPMIQVIAMQILYGATMAAIFVLCLVLLWTARRILRSSPLANAELSLARLHEATNQGKSSTELDYAGIAQFDIEPQLAEISPSLIDTVALRMMASEQRVEIETAAGPIQAPIQAALETPELPQMDIHLTEIADNSEVPAQQDTTRMGRIARHLPHGYNYLLEGLLLGVSVFVLVRTQKSSWRSHRSLRSSDQVA